MSSDIEGAVDLAALSAWLVSQEVSVDGDLRLELIGGGRSNLTFSVTDDHHRWILRRPPLGAYHRGAHDVGREYRVMAALQDSSVPVPVMIANCEDPSVIGAPFYLMQEVAGVVLRSREMVAELTPETALALSESLVDTLADLHEVDVEAVGLSRLGKPQGYLERQLARWQKQYHAVSTRHTDRVHDVVAALSAAMPVSETVSIVHGDFRIDNVIVNSSDRGVVAAVLDWEMATLGDPLADLATLVMFWDEVGRPFNPITGGLTAFPGFLSVDEVVQAYAERRSLDQRDVDSLDWYLAFSKFKLAVILEQIHVRHASGQTLGAGFEGIDLMVDQLLGECVPPSPGVAHATP
ncbi:phosphotransferase family protein [Nocardioides sp.]|uniref:phosphotransferase family protein n=1 Tax=Nocardioides sp. TaxID=35761 RepID=UPI003D14CC15